MRAITTWVKADFFDPPMNNSCVLPGRDVGRFMDSAWEQEIVRLESRHRDPVRNTLSRRRRNFELHWLLCFLLHDNGPSGDVVAVAHVLNAQFYKIAAAKLAIDGKVEQRQFTNVMRQLQTHSDRPNFV